MDSNNFSGARVAESARSLFPSKMNFPNSCEELFCAAAVRIDELLSDGEAFVFDRLVHNHSSRRGQYYPTASSSIAQ